MVSSNEKTQEFDYYFQKKRPEMLDFIPKNARVVLDIGCAQGGFGEELKTMRSIEVWGIEPNERAASFASQKLDRVINANFGESLNYLDRKFDCIIFNDVLEHLVDPYTTLKDCHSLLNEDGVIVASIPNIRYFDNIWNLVVYKNWEYADWGILDRTHLRFFTYKSIISTFESLGYSLEKIQGINTLKTMNSPHLKKFNLLNKIFFNHLEDMNYLQFALIARPNI